MDDRKTIDSLVLGAAVRAHLLDALIADGVPADLIDASHTDSHPLAVRVTRPYPKPVSVLVCAVGPGFYAVSCGETLAECSCGSALLPGCCIAGALTGQPTDRDHG